MNIFVACFREWVLDGTSLSDRTLLEQKFIGQRLTRNKMMGLKLQPLADPQTM